jgi:hypothetical protein
MIPKNVKIKNGELPDSPGVCPMKDAKGSYTGEYLRKALR